MAAITTGSTVEFELRATKFDGTVWNLSAAAITLYFRKPSGTLLTKTGTVTDGPAGIAKYTTTVTDLDVPGQWTHTWRVVDEGGAVDVKYAPLGFPVIAAP